MSSLFNHAKINEASIRHSNNVPYIMLIYKRIELQKLTSKIIISIWMTKNRDIIVIA